jgi:hypothetical protein
LTVKTRPRVEAAAVISDSTDNQYLNELKIGTITSGLQKRYSRVFTKMLRQNAIALADFITSANTEINLSDRHKMNIIDVLNSLSNHFESKKSFRNMKREDIISFLDNVRKSEISDPHHKWIGTYNLYRVLIIKFFKWLYYPEMQPSKRPKPSLVENIPQLKEKRSRYTNQQIYGVQRMIFFS